MTTVLDNDNITASGIYIQKGLPMLTLFTLLIALTADRILGFKSEPLVVRWFAGYVAYMGHIYSKVKWLSAKGLEIFWVILLLLPLMVAIFLGCKSLSFSGLTHFIVVGFLTWLALGTVDSSTIVTVYKNGDLSVFQPLLAETGHSLKLDTDEAVAHLVLWQALQSTFGVIFWLIIIGPIAALLYLFLSLLSTRDISSVLNVALRNAALKLHVIIDWLPARLYSLTLAVVGNGKEGWQLWWENLTVENHALVTLCGMQGFETSQKDLPLRALDKVNRSLFAWLIIITVITVIHHL